MLMATQTQLLWSWYSGGVVAFNIFNNIQPRTTKKTMPTLVKSISSEQTIITLQPNQQLTNYMIFPPDTMIVATFYINNQQDIPSGATGNVVISLTDARSGQTSQILLNSYVYGKYLENYPATNITLINNYNVQIQIYFQYTLKQYSEYSNPVIQDLTELLLIPTVIVNSLTASTNFRYYGSINNFSLANFNIGDSFYVLMQQVYGTSSTSAGYVQVPYTANYTENINVSALGAAEDANIYYFTVDSVTKQLPGSITQSNAVMNWVQIDFYSPLLIQYTTQTFDIIYNAATNTFSLAANTSLNVQSVAMYLPTQPASFCVYNVMQ